MFNMSHNLSEIINNCLLPKFSKNFDEKDDHVEYKIRNINIAENFQYLIENLDKLRKLEETTTTLSCLLNLYLELSCECLWNNPQSKAYADKLNIYFELQYGVQLKNILYKNNKIDSQTVFYKLLEDLHKKLTCDNFKKYPGQIEVYNLVVTNMKNYEIPVKFLQIVPASLILIDDYIESNKVKGLKCCLSILQSLTSQDFQGGNYHEVIYQSLIKTFLDTNDEVTNLTYLCLLELCRTIPSDEKHDKFGDLFTKILDKLYMESNIHKKNKCIEFTKNIISLHKDNCIGKSKHFNLIICDCLDMCTNNGVAEVMLAHTLQCVEEWIKYCWCIWKLSSNHKMISVLFKVMYSNNDKIIVLHIQRILVTLICLCSPIEKKQIQCSIEKNVSIVNNDFKEKLLALTTEIDSFK